VFSVNVPHQFRAAYVVAATLLLNGQALAQQQSGAVAGAYVPQPQSGMYGSMGNVYSPYYRYRQPSPGMTGMGFLPGTYGMSAPPVYLYSPQMGMYGSMGNVYHPAYRTLQQPGMGGMSGGAP
jgi:hypothetical protein